MHSKKVSKRIDYIGIGPCARMQNSDRVQFAADTLCAAQPAGQIMHPTGSQLSTQSFLTAN
jgi:hypothetical protein